MRRPVPAALLVVASVLAPAPVAAAEVEQRVTATGALTVTWRGDPARGCAEQGVCDVRGSVSATPGDDQGTVTSSGPEPPQLDIDVALGRPTVRVERGPPDHPAGVCTDALADLTLGLRGGLRTGPVDAAFDDLGEAGLSAGRCAGPTRADLAGLLRQLTVAREGLLRVTLTGRRTLAAGPYAVEVDATLRAAARRRTVREESRIAGGGRSAPAPRVRLRRRAVLLVRYAVERPAGTLTTTFAGLPRAGCVILDACGVRGASRLTVTGTEAERLELSADGPVAIARGRSVARARAALAAGRMELDAGDFGPALGGRVEAEVTRDGASGVCRDARDVVLPQLRLAERGRGVDVVVGGSEYEVDDLDVRTRCAGPVESGVRLLAAPLPLRAIGAPAIALRLRPGAADDTWPFAATRDGEVTLTLRRTSARVVVREVPDL